MLPLVPVLDESRPLDRLGVHAVGQGLPDGNGRRCRNGQCACCTEGRRGKGRAPPEERGLARPDRQAPTEWKRPDAGLPPARQCAGHAASSHRAGPQALAGPPRGPELGGPSWTQGGSKGLQGSSKEGSGTRQPGAPGPAATAAPAARPALGRPSGLRAPLCNFLGDILGARGAVGAEWSKPHLLG
jgi:hypothetical protein